MKTKITRYATRITFFATALLATCLLAGTANAQGGFQGKFTLPFETHWGQAVLSGGDYLLTYDGSISNVLVIRNAKTGQRVAVEQLNVRDDSAGGKSALLIATRGSRHIVYSLRIAEFGQVFIYDRELARAATVEVARQTQTVPVFVAKK